MKPPTKKRPWWVIEPEKDIACPRCDLSSGFRGGSTCSRCNGTGKIKEADYFADMLPKTESPIVLDAPFSEKDAPK